MKVYLSNYRHHWFSPYTMIDNLFFWTAWSKCRRDKSLARAMSNDENESKWVDRPEWVEKWHDRLTPLSEAIQTSLNFIHPKVDYVKVDDWDTWNMDHSLAQITLPMLRQLHAKNHSAPLVDDDDVPEELKSTSAPPKENEWDTDQNHFKRWHWVMEEMIFAFESKLDESWKKAFQSGSFDKISVPIDYDGNEIPKSEAKLFRWENGANHTYQCDYDGMRVVEARIQNGFRLFGRYYQNLWD
jgi:hypothetical protein